MPRAASPAPANTRGSSEGPPAAAAVNQATSTIITVLKNHSVHSSWSRRQASRRGGGAWGVISARSSYYGETLGKNIRYLVEASTGIRSVVIAGSGGSLAPAPLYSLTYPSHVLTAGGQAEPNALASLADYTAHVSVVSPMEETPAWLAGALGNGVATGDCVADTVGPGKVPDAGRVTGRL